jgi:hypothetical protein
MGDSVPDGCGARRDGVRIADRRPARSGYGGGPNPRSSATSTGSSWWSTSLGRTTGRHSHRRSAARQPGSRVRRAWAIRGASPVMPVGRAESQDLGPVEGEAAGGLREGLGVVDQHADPADRCVDIIAQDEGSRFSAVRCSYCLTVVPGGAVLPVGAGQFSHRATHAGP